MKFVNASACFRLLMERCPVVLFCGLSARCSEKERRGVKAEKAGITFFRRRFSFPLFELNLFVAKEKPFRGTLTDYVTNQGDLARALLVAGSMVGMLAWSGLLSLPSPFWGRE